MENWPRNVTPPRTAGTKLLAFLSPMRTISIRREPGRDASGPESPRSESATTTHGGCPESGSVGATESRRFGSRRYLQADDHDRQTCRVRQFAQCRAGVAGNVGLAPSAAAGGSSGLRLAPSTGGHDQVPVVPRVPWVRGGSVRRARDGLVALAPTCSGSLRSTAGRLDHRDVRPQPGAHPARGWRPASLLPHFSTPGCRAQVRSPRSGHERPQILRPRPGVGQHALDLRERRDAVDGLRGGIHVGVRQRSAAVLSARGRASCLVRAHADRDPLLGLAALLLRSSPPALEAALPDCPRAAPQERQHGTVVRALHAPHRAPHLPQQHPDPRGHRVTPDPHPLSHAMEHPRRSDLAHGIRIVDGQGAADSDPRVVSPPASPPLLRLQLRQPLHAVGPVARYRPRRHASGHGRASKAPSRTNATRGGDGT